MIFDLSLPMLLYIGLIIIAVIVLWLCPPIRKYVEDKHQLLTLCLIAIAGGYAAVSYLEAKADNRLKESLAYVQRGQSGEVALARAWMDGFFVDNKAEYDNAFAKTGAEAEEALLLLENEALSTPNGRNKIMTLLYFYSDLASCVSLDVCDGPTLCEQFQNEITENFGRFSSFIQSWSDVTFSERKSRVDEFIRNCHL